MAWQQNWGSAHQNVVEKPTNYFPFVPKKVQMPSRKRTPDRIISCSKGRSNLVNNGTASGDASKPDVLQVTRGGAEVFGPRVVQILRGRVHGLYQMQVESQYKKGWGEELPDNWIDTLAGSDYGVVTEKVGAHLLCHEVKQVKVANSLNGELASRETQSRRCVTLPLPKVHQICSDLRRPKE